MTFLNITSDLPMKRLLASTALIIVASFGLGGCESSKNGYGLSAPSSTASVSKHKAKKSKKSTSKKSAKNKKRKSSKNKSYNVAVARIGGLPKSLSKSFSASLKRAIKAKHIQSASASKHKVKGYFAATSQKGKTKVSYVLDVTNKAGKRIKRIHGSELVKGDPKNPWKHVSKSVLKKIAKRTANTLSATVTGAAPLMMAYKMPSEKEIDRVKKAPKTTASLKSVSHAAKMSAFIPAVEGAPGDGKVSLTRAITKQLAGRGIKIETIEAPGVHSVRGYVSLRSLNAKQDQVTIKWLVFNSKGRRLGIVSQKNAIAKGSLNGSWGRIANAAAGAAAKGIRKLLPNTKM